MSLVCLKCGGSILDSDETIYYEVIGFEREREQGGTNHIRDRKRTGRMAHAHCLDREAQGIPATQEALL